MEEAERLRSELQYAWAESNSYYQENEYLRDLLHDLGIEDPDKLNSTQTQEIKEAVASVWRPYFVTDQGQAAAQMFRQDANQQ